MMTGNGYNILIVPEKMRFVNRELCVIMNSCDDVRVKRYFALDIM